MTSYVFRNRYDWKTTIFVGNDDTGFLLRIAVVAYAGLLTVLLPAPVFLHYFMTIFPMGFVWLVRMINKNESRYVTNFQLIAGVVVLQAIISISSAIYVHREIGAPPGHFGVRTPDTVDLLN